MLDLFLAHRGEMLSIAQEFGLAPQQAFALQRLQPDEPMKLSDLAQALHCDNSSVTGIADRLEKAGLAERQAHPTDRRVKTLALTAKGAELRAAYEARLSHVPPELKALSDEDATALLEIMCRVTPGAQPPVRPTSPTA